MSFVLARHLIICSAIKDNQFVGIEESFPSYICNGLTFFILRKSDTTRKF